MTTREKVADGDINTLFTRAREREKKSSQLLNNHKKKEDTHIPFARATLFLFEPASSAMSQQRRMMMRRRRLSSSASRDEDECERREKLVEKRKEATIRKQIERVRRHKKRQQQQRTTTFPSRSPSERRRGGAEEESALFSSRLVYFFGCVVFVVGVLLLAFFSLKEFEIGRRQMRSHLLVFTRERLRFASSERNYLSVAGEVFDVSGGNGDLFYGEGKEYNFFVGTDQTKGFLTGKREESNVDVETLTNGEVLEIEKWVRFYRRGGSKGAYRKRGVLGDGWFYDERGEKTARAIRFWERVEEAKEEAKREEEEEESKATPLCRAAWTEERGGTVWCDQGEDATVTYPRLNAKNGLCECHEDQGYSDLRKLYENCDAKSTRCFTG